METMLQKLGQRFEREHDTIMNEFFKFLRFASVSSDPACNNATIACKDWIEGFLVDTGFKVSQWPTSEHPVIFAENLTAGPDKPTVLIYNHYDVQPVDPLELWDNPPFEPVVKNESVYARGAQDNKGQCFYVLQSLKALKEVSCTFPVNIKLLIEGNEETGSGGLSGILENKKEDLKADYIFIVDVGIKDAETPTITLGLRGIVAMDVSCKGSDTDLHSGCHGGLAYNPLHALVDILAKLRDADGRITVPGFYDNVREIPAEQRGAISFDFDEKKYLKEFGVQPTGGETKYSPLERNWLRPTLEINGITGGFSGPGTKTVIPALASAKLTCRLVPNQDPQVIAKAVTSYIEKLAPPGINVTTHIHAGGGTAVITDPNSIAVKAVATAFSEVFQKPCQYILEGASIPIVTALQRVSGGQVVLLGLGLTSDLIHAPNEHFSLKRIQQGYLIIARSLEILGES
ncbi:MAG: dipeptidase [Chlamydiales bacterium]|nr:dipeptidase [Chlamydiales bacterium]